MIELSCFLGKKDTESQFNKCCVSFCMSKKNYTELSLTGKEEDIIQVYCNKRERELNFPRNKKAGGFLRAEMN